MSQYNPFVADLECILAEVRDSDDATDVRRDIARLIELFIAREEATP